MRSVHLSLILGFALCGACGDDSNNNRDDGGQVVIDASPIDAPAPAGIVCRDGTTVQELRLFEVASGLTRPLFLTHAPGDARLFIVEQDGRIRIIKDGQLLTEPYMTLTVAGRERNNEMGLLGLAFHPNFASNGRLFVNYTWDDDLNPDNLEQNTQPPYKTVIAEFVVDPGSDKIDNPTEERLLEIEQKSGNHNGGMIAFGPDGYLYIGMGDEGGGDDTHKNAQNVNTLNGAMLRIDVNSGDKYGIPDGNPFKAGGGSPELYAWGLRNPWRWSFDRMTGDIYIGDVGQSAGAQREEINARTSANLAGSNFGWSCKQGFDEYLTGAENCPVDLTPMIDPIAAHNNTIAKSITGGYVYRGNCLPALKGTYFYADYVTQIIKTLRWNSGNNQVTDEVDISDSLKTGVGVAGIPSFGEDKDGELYLLSFSGSVFRIGVPAP